MSALLFAAPALSNSEEMLKAPTLLIREYPQFFSGNELCGTGVGVRVAAAQYSSDTISFVSLVQDIYKGVEFQPLIIAPGGFFDANWFKEYVSKTPKLNVVTHHIYNLGAGNM